ncbi:MAG: L-threonylcarbamoyladenylate synthase [Chlamydiia bacterium]
MGLLSLHQAIDALLTGEVVAIPTETVYGLAASLHGPEAIERIFVLKGRPRHNPLIVHVADIEEARSLTLNWSPAAESLAKLWPGPLTLLLPRNPYEVPDSVTAGSPLVGIRIPSHPLCRELLRQTGPLVAPSANLSGRPSASQAGHVLEDFRGKVGVLDGGPCEAGLESTIILVEETPRIVRLGALSKEWIEELTGLTISHVMRELAPDEKPICPGQLLRHYAPRCRLQPLSLSTPPVGGLVLGFKERFYDSAEVWDLGSLESPDLTARALYHLLRELDRLGREEAWYDDRLPFGGLWDTITERLSRAASQSGLVLL